MTKLKLGPLVEERPVKIAIELPAATFLDLTRYAEILARETKESVGSIEPAKLVAPMIARFMATDRAFLKLRRASAPSPSVAIMRSAGSKAGGERAAQLYTVIESAKLNGLEPQAYIADVIEKIAQGWPASRWDELMPWNWEPPQTQIAQAA